MEPRLFADAQRHRRRLDRLFFSDPASSPFSLNSKSHTEFWEFYERLRRFSNSSRAAASAGDFRLPLTPCSSQQITLRYDKTLKLNVRISNRAKDDYIRHRADCELRSTDLTDEQLHFFEYAIVLYIDFLQKQKLQKLVQLQQARRSLPVHAHRAEIVAAVRDNQVAIVAGDTGCGKSTQVPQYLLEAGIHGLAVTQPRRLACISLAARVSRETMHEYGGLVGHQVRFDKARSSATKLLFLTEGLLLRHMQAEPTLEQFNVILLDEVHERHVQTDMLLGLLRCLLRLRPSVKLVLMSATINLHLFVNFFGGSVPVVKVPGRLHPIQVEYWPVRDSELSSRSERLNPAPYLRVLQRIDAKYPSSERGDLLIFFAGLQDIVSVSEAASEYARDTGDWLVLPLHSSLSAEQQDRVFHVAPEGTRKCIVATNIAETSVTIDGVRFVADSGRVKEMSWDPSCRMQRLQQFWISRASAEQRKGRAGRTGPGVAFRLFAEQDYDAMQEYSTPELLRLPLDSLLLQLIAMGLPDVRKFPFVESPPSASIELCLSSLKQHGAIDAEERLTPIGHLLAQLPLDLILGKMLLHACVLGLAEPALLLAALLTVQSPLTARPSPEAERARGELLSAHGEVFSLMQVCEAWLREKSDGETARGGGQSRSWCRRRGIEEQRLYEALRLRRQFARVLRDHRLLPPLSEEEGEEREEDEGERRRRGGRREGEDRRQRQELRSLKRQHRSERQKPKLLRLDADAALDDTAGHSEERDIASDIHDLELRLSRGVLPAEAAAISGSQLQLLKFVLAAGLYPQLAVADSGNASRPRTEQAYHTRAKKFVLLQPQDPLAAHAPQAHEVLAYVRVLDTTRPHLQQPVPVAAAPTLLLLAASVAGNADGTRLVCDDWLELRIASPHAAEAALGDALQLRTQLSMLLQHRLVEPDAQPDLGAPQEARRFTRRLAEFLTRRVDCSVRQVSPDELGRCVYDRERSGQRLADWLQLDVLLDEEAAAMLRDNPDHLERLWQCPHCDHSALCSLKQRLEHLSACRQNGDHNDADNVDDADANAETAGRASKEEHSFHCSHCGTIVRGSTICILRHRRDCAEPTLTKNPS